jgi:uncharacterized protein (TIGR01777 family)
MKRVAVTGASGFVGRAVVQALAASGTTVVALGREAPSPGLPANVEFRRFDPGDSAPNPAAFEGCDAVIHLAGESVAGRWTEEKKRRIYESRVDGTRALVRSLAASARKPAVLVSASASGYYGDRGDEPLFETSPPGDDYLAGVCAAWEHEAATAEELGVRVVALRTAVVLGNGGALAQMLPPFRLGVGGPFGGGRQFMPWIHLDDLVSLYRFAVETDALRGPVNAVAPDFATSARFAQALGAAVGRPALLPAPKPALRLLLGEFAETLFASQLMLPAAAQAHGFTWRHPMLENALIDVVSPNAHRRTGMRRFQQGEIVAGSLDDVFAFFSDAGNLARITPPSMHFAMEDEPARMGAGALIDYRLRVRGVPLRWRTMIAEWDPPHRFVDVQLHGPYALWRHTHRFDAVPGGVRIGDEVVYALPFAPFGNIAAPVVDADVRAIFAYRTAAISRIRESRAPS